MTRAQALAQGLSPSAISRRCSNGTWQRLLPNVFASASASPTRNQQLKSVELWAGEGAVISHRSALQFWGVALNADFIEVSTPNRRRPHEGVRMHRVRSLPAEHVVTRDGIRVTSVERTLVDLAPVLGEELQGILDDFVRQGVLTPASLALFVESKGAKRVPGCHRLRRLLRKRRKEEPRTHPEQVSLLMKVLQRNFAAKVPAPQPLPQLANAPQPFRLGYESERLVLELGEGMPKEAGKWRAKLRGEGWEVIGITYPELSKKPWKGRHFHKCQQLLGERCGMTSRV